MFKTNALSSAIFCILLLIFTLVVHAATLPIWGWYVGVIALLLWTSTLIKEIVKRKRHDR